MKQINKVGKGIVIVAIVISILFPTIIAENSTGNESINTTAIMENIEKDEAICEEQIELVIEQYNSLLDDFRSDINCNTDCGAAYVMLKGMNEELDEERNICIKEREKLKDYRVGFFILLPALVMIGIVFIIISRKE